MKTPYFKWLHGGCCVPVALAIVVAAPPAGSAALLNVDGAFQQSSKVTSTNPPGAGSCLEGDGSQDCYIVFTPVPVGKKLVVTQVSCELNVSVGAEVTRLHLAPMRGASKFVERFQFLTSIARPGAPTGTNIVVNNTAYQLFDEKDRPIIYIRLTTDSVVAGFCSISGELSNKGP